MIQILYEPESSLMVLSLQTLKKQEFFRIGSNQIIPRTVRISIHIISRQACKELFEICVCIWLTKQSCTGEQWLLQRLQDQTGTHEEQRRHLHGPMVSVVHDVILLHTTVTLHRLSQ